LKIFSNNYIINYFFSGHTFHCCASLQIHRSFQEFKKLFKFKINRILIIDSLMNPNFSLKFINILRTIWPKFYVIFYWKFSNNFFSPILWSFTSILFDYLYNKLIIHWKQKSINKFNYEILYTHIHIYTHFYTHIHKKYWYYI
jgi:hypothetical protein